MRVCSCSDFHGRTVLYEQLTALLAAERPDLLILGGDMHTECDRADPHGSQVTFVSDFLLPTIGTWRKAQPRLIVACVLGNHDCQPTCEAVRTQHDAGNLILLDAQTPTEIGGLPWLGYSSSPPSPFWIKDLERLDRPGDAIPNFDGARWDAEAGTFRDVSAEAYFAEVPTIAEELAGAAHAAGPWAFVCHAPPYRTALDRLPNLQDGIGSRSVRKFIEERQPLFSLHGHVHESPSVSGKFADRVGQTWCVNAGQTHDRLQAVVFDTADPAGTVRHSVFG